MSGSWARAIFARARCNREILLNNADFARFDLHHIGIVVADLDDAVQRYEDLGFPPGERMEMPDQGVILVTFMAGPGVVEIISPTDPEGAIARFLNKRGDGMHHVAYRVADIQAELDRLAAAGLRLIDSNPRIGAHGWRVAFVHPESCCGVLTELVQVDC
ncbi:MAG: methylmalonyl-CoA epimerase [Thermomicrobiales bacterium]